MNPDPDPTLSDNIIEITQKFKFKKRTLIRSPSLNFISPGTVRKAILFRILICSMPRKILKKETKDRLLYVSDPLSY